MCGWRVYQQENSTSLFNLFEGGRDTLGSAEEGGQRIYIICGLAL